MHTAARQLAEFAASLRLDTLAQPVLERARACVADTVACAVHGAQFAWSRSVADYATRYGAGGPCTLFGVPGGGVQAPFAALYNGAAAHAFEQDSLRFPGAGVHPGAALVPTIAAACEDASADGATALRAFVAGCEVLFRIGAATHHSSEKLGFHAPGLTGVYGSAVAAGVVYGLDGTRIAHAMGIAGSMSAGLLAFTKAQHGAMVKRLHMGRACEAGIVAARLAEGGTTGPETILEGRFGFLEAYCRDAEPALLTQGLGSQWETLRICFKRYACHVTAQAPVQALRELVREHGLQAAQVQTITLHCSEKVCSHHDIRAPQDVMQAQYSVPFCLALALDRDPDQPAAFDAAAVHDPGILATCARVVLEPVRDLPTAWSARLTVLLRDGTQLQRDAFSFQGMPGDDPPDTLRRARFLALCAPLGEPAAIDLHTRLCSLQTQAGFPVPVAVPVAS